jgi:transposase
MGCMDRASLEQMLNQGLSLAEIGRRVGKHESTVAYWVAQFGLEAVNRDKHAARGALSHEKLERFAESGASIAEIADAVDRSKPTVRHWLREYGLKTRRGTMRQVRAQQRARFAQPTRMILDCPHHGATEFQLRAEGGYRCLKCRSDAVSRRRRKVKQTLVEEAGGACQLCGYARCIAALEFHHREPREKSFALSHRGVARSLARARAEAAKCVLLCANCHAEVEAGMHSLA